MNCKSDGVIFAGEVILFYLKLEKIVFSGGVSVVGKTH